MQEENKKRKKACFLFLSVDACQWIQLVLENFDTVCIVPSVALSSMWVFSRATLQLSFHKYSAILARFL